MLYEYEIEIDHEFVTSETCVLAKNLLIGV